eukprot:TRINITY_DN29153_c0_g1_i1.p1 TRINITY_DN29153_c0_g1~~TRINITY_DN29153_c0_g1_i1.p1  ORF type:complete len:318 (-),score=62.55 TRINITY_DN29153_c0_g1_i1:170-1123(-)
MGRSNFWRGLTGQRQSVEKTQTVQKTIYLVRHGEALHNIEERLARKRAAKEALKDGHVEGSDEAKRLVTRASDELLLKEHLRDAPLSDAGRLQTMDARSELAALMEVGPDGLAWPTRVLVSPLERTLQTASILFPDHPSIHVCEELRERRTGRPCDDRKPAEDLSRRPEFAGMDFSVLQDLDKLLEATEDGGGSEAPAIFEDSKALRQRTIKLTNYLQSMEDDSICLVTHKALLRELERGPLAREGATEAGNCEVRVYKFTVDKTDSNAAMSAELVHSRDSPLPRLRGAWPLAEKVSAGPYREHVPGNLCAVPMRVQ